MTKDKPIREQEVVVRKRAEFDRLAKESGYLIAHRGGHRFKPHQPFAYQLNGDWRIPNSRDSFDNAGVIATRHGVTPMVETDTLLSKEGLELLNKFNPAEPGLPPNWKDAIFLAHGDPKPTPRKNKQDWPLFWLGDLTPSEKFSYETPAAELRTLPYGIRDAERKLLTQSPAGTGPQRMLSLVEFLEEYVDKRGYNVQIEIKPRCYSTYRKINEDKSPAVQEQARKEGQLIMRIINEVLGEKASHVTVLSCSAYALDGVHREAPKVPTFLLMVPENIAKINGDDPPENGTYSRLDPYLKKKEVANILDECHVAGIHYMTSNVDPSVLAFYTARGFKSVLGGADDPRAALTLLTKGTTCLSADNYDAVLSRTHQFKREIAGHIGAHVRTQGIEP